MSKTESNGSVVSRIGVRVLCLRSDISLSHTSKLEGLRWCMEVS